MSTNTIANLTVEDYSEYSFVVRGDTRPHLNSLKNLGGKWNSRLKDGACWIFPKRLKGDIEQWIESGKVNRTSGNNLCGSPRPNTNITQHKLYDNNLGKKVMELEKKIDKLSYMFEKVIKILDIADDLNYEIKEKSNIEVKKGGKEEEEEDEDEVDTEGHKVPRKRLLK